MLFLITLVLPLIQGAGLSYAQDDVFRILDRFDRFDAWQRPFVKVATGRWFEPEDEPAQNSYKFGFLLSSSKRRFTVRFLPMTTETFEPTPPGTPEHKRVGWVAADLEKVAGLMLPSSDYTFPWYVFPEQAFAALVARACARTGHADKAREIWKDLDARMLSQQLGQALCHQLCIEFTDESLSRAELLARHKLWLESFPGDIYADSVRKRSAALERMVAEDKRWASTRNDQQRPLETTMVELVRSLRDEFHARETIGFSSWILPTKARQDDDCPIALIRKAGFAAIPALIDALGDGSLTRTVWYSSRFGGSFGVESVGSVADLLLCEITGFDRGNQAAWSEWWRTASVKGERAARLEILASQNVVDLAPARRLVSRWPDSVSEVIRIAGETKAGPKRAQLVALIAETRSQAVTTFLLRELDAGPDLGARVIAAKALFARGHRPAIEPLKRAWRGFVRERDGVLQELAEFLLVSGDPEAVRLVAESPYSHELVRALRSAELDALVEHVADTHSPVVTRTIEHALVAALDDARASGGTDCFEWRNQSVTCRSPRVCDYAACALASLWPNRYAFDPDAPATGRDLAIRDMKNAWRRANRKPPERK